MFTLIKILNSRSNVPEPIKLPCNANANIKIGTALHVSAGKVASCDATTKPTYIAAANSKSGEGEVLCYPVSPDMLFETTISTASTSLTVGAKLTLYVDFESCAVGVTATTASGVAEIAEPVGALVAGDKITVKF